MFFLLRMAFWIGLVLVLLPTDKTTTGENVPDIRAGDAMSAAASAVSDMSQFCTRQPDACAVGGQAATAIGHRAQAGAKKLYQIITEKKPDTTGSISAGGISDVPEPETASQQTLSADDLQPEWRLPVAVPETVPAAR